MLIFLLRPPPVHLPFLGILLVPVPCLLVSCGSPPVSSGAAVPSARCGQGTWWALCEQGEVQVWHMGAGSPQGLCREASGCSAAPLPRTASFLLW